MSVICNFCNQMVALSNTPTGFRPGRARNRVLIERERMIAALLEKCPARKEGFNNCYDRQSSEQVVGGKDSEFLDALSRENFCNMTNKQSELIRKRLGEVAAKLRVQE